MIINREWLESREACSKGKDWFFAQKEIELTKIVKALIKDSKFEWANWTLTKAMTHKQNVQYACYSAKQSLHLFEKAYPEDKTPRKAIEAAMRWVKDPSELNRSAAWSAAAESAVESAAWSAAAESVAWSAAAESVAWSAAAESAARSARSACYAARSARSAAESAAAESAARSARSAWYAAWSARSAAESAAAESATWRRILKYGVRLAKGNV